MRPRDGRLIERETFPRKRGGDRIDLVIDLDEQCPKDGQRDRHFHPERRADALLGSELDRAAESTDRVLDNVESDAAARQLGHAFGGREARPCHDPEQFLIGRGAVAVDQPLGPTLSENGTPVDSAAVIADFDDHT